MSSETRENTSYCFSSSGKTRSIFSHRSLRYIAGPGGGVGYMTGPDMFARFVAGPHGGSAMADAKGHQASFSAGTQGGIGSYGFKGNMHTFFQGMHGRQEEGFRFFLKKCIIGDTSYIAFIVMCAPSPSVLSTVRSGEGSFARDRLCLWC